MAWVAAAIIGSAVVGGVVSSKASKSAANSQEQAAQSAADAQVRAAEISADASLTGSREANALIQQQFLQNRQDQLPWMQAGQSALAQQSGGLAPGGDFNRDFQLSDFQNDPGLAYRLSQGRAAIEGSAASRGMLLSGGTLKALTAYGQDQGSQEYGNAYNRWNADRDRRFSRLSAVAGTGQATAQQVGAQGTAAAGQQAGNVTGAAASRASSYTDAGRATADAYIGSGNARAAGTVGAANAFNTGLGNAVNGFQSQQYLNTLRPQQQAQPYIPAFGQTSYEG